MCRMDLNFSITNEEDIKFLEKTKISDRVNILQTAISIGFKSIQMSETRLDCHSYIDPIKQMILLKHL